MLCTSDFVDDVMFADNRPGKSDATRQYTQSDSTEGSTAGGVAHKMAIVLRPQICDVTSPYV